MKLSQPKPDEVTLLLFLDSLRKDPLMCSGSKALVVPSNVQPLALSQIKEVQQAAFQLERAL